MEFKVNINWKKTYGRRPPAGARLPYEALLNAIKTGRGPGELKRGETYLGRMKNDYVIQLYFADNTYKNGMTVGEVAYILMQVGIPMGKKDPITGKRSRWKIKRWPIWKITASKYTRKWRRFINNIGRMITMNEFRNIRDGYLRLAKEVKEDFLGVYHMLDEPALEKSTIRKKKSDVVLMETGLLERSVRVRVISSEEAGRPSLYNGRTPSGQRFFDKGERTSANTMMLLGALSGTHFLDESKSLFEILDALNDKTSEESTFLREYRDARDSFAPGSKEAQDAQNRIGDILYDIGIDRE